MNAVFVDTMGWYGLVDKRDSAHAQAAQALAGLGRRLIPLVTTDYVLDETATLLKVRGAAHLAVSFFDRVEASRALTVARIDAGRFALARAYFVKHIDHGYSFTDVTSFIVMRELGITEVLTKDEHFVEAGFTKLIA